MFSDSSNGNMSEFSNGCFPFIKRTGCIHEKNIFDHRETGSCAFKGVYIGSDLRPVKGWSSILLI